MPVRMERGKDRRDVMMARRETEREREGGRVGRGNTRES